RLLSTLEEALTSLESSAHIDVVFISNRFAQTEVLNFINRAKEKPGGQDSAYVIVLSTDSQQSNTVAQNVLGGADGFLLEPYSVDSLVEITVLAERVKRERSQQREAAALNFLVQDVLQQIDRVAYLKSCGFDAGRSLKTLREMCSVFQSLEYESRELYLEIAVKSFIDASPSKFVKSYKGASDRVSKAMERKIANQIAAEEEALRNK
ncbi:MAG: hypothetical protein GX589_10450, partial [Deltaproteobacteria bacterium]|nr:hypothetical protein [Deltaproteobacteria bacterium]